jgi:diacylglycerol kinase (ATP)
MHVLLTISLSFVLQGVGFDAYVSSLFAQAGKRGFQTYVKSTLKAFFGYKPEIYTLQTDEGTIEVKAFAITFANASQYGNNAYIAPNANIRDGYIDICILKPFPKWKMPLLGISLFMKLLPKLKYYQSFRVKNVLLKRENAGAVHIDGENLSLGTQLKISIQPQSLYVVTG